MSHFLLWASEDPQIYSLEFRWIETPVLFHCPLDISLLGQNYSPLLGLDALVTSNKLKVVNNLIAGDVFDYKVCFCIE